MDVPSDQHLYWGNGWPIWNNESDLVVVCDDPDHPVLARRYERTDAGEYEIEEIDEGALEDWFPEPSIRTPIPIPFVSVAPTVALTAIKNAILFVASAFFLRGTEAFVATWAQITGFLFIAVLTWVLSTTSGLLTPSVEPIGPFLLLAGSVLLTILGGILDLARRVVGLVLKFVT